VGAERGGELVRYWDGAFAAGGFGVGEDQASTGLALQRAAYPQQAVVQVQVLPPQAERFTLAQAQGQADQPAGLHPVILGGFDQPVRFGDGQRGDLMLGRAGYATRAPVPAPASTSSP
jgi:hypothetical protein